MALLGATAALTMANHSRQAAALAQAGDIASASLGCRGRRQRRAAASPAPCSSSSSGKSRRSCHSCRDSSSSEGSGKECKHRKKSHKKCKCDKECSCNCGHSSSSEETPVDKCDVIMAHGYKDIYASSTLDVPFGWTKRAQQQQILNYTSFYNSGLASSSLRIEHGAANNYESNFWDDQDYNFRGLSNVHTEAGAWHDNLCIGHYGLTTLRPRYDIERRTGATDGWLADCLSPNWRFNFASDSSSAADVSACRGSSSRRGHHGGGSSSSCGCSNRDKSNAYREFLTVLMPYPLEIYEIRTQGIRSIDIGGRRGVPATDTDEASTAGIHTSLNYRVDTTP